MADRPAPLSNIGELSIGVLYSLLEPVGEEGSYRRECPKCAGCVNLEGVRRVIQLQSEVDRLQRQVRRLRRLLGDAEARSTGTAGGVRRVGHARGHLPDVPRPTLRRLLEG